jgi:lysozyme
MKTTAQPGINIIKKYEGFKAKPYLCPARIPTIGYGNTYYPNGNKVKLTDPPTTEPNATALLMSIIGKYEDAVNRYAQKPINQNQFDALVSFTYNLGMENLRTSTLMKKLNVNPKDATIKDEFLKWTRANGVVLAGLKKRREEEAQLYFS